MYNKVKCVQQRVIRVIHCAKSETLQDCVDHIKRSNLVCTFKLTVLHLHDI